MFKQQLLLLLFSFFSVVTIAQDYNEINLLINYESNTTTELEPQLQTVLQTILENVPTNEEIAHVELVALGEQRHIGEKRMEVIQSFLVEKGLEISKIQIATQLYNQEEVEVIIKTAKVIENKFLVTTQKEENTTPKRYCAGASKKAQFFEIKPNQNISIVGKEGTKLTINRADLVDKNGLEVQGTIQVELKEFYKPADILLADLHTMDGDEILETGGMLNLVITANKEPLELREGKTANVQMPTQYAKSMEGMDLYVGATTEDGAVDWKVEKPSFNVGSYVKLKTQKIIDSIVYKKINTDHLVSNGYPMNRTKSVEYSHDETYFDLELPYISNWINLDKPIDSVRNAAVQNTEVLVKVDGLPIKCFDENGLKITEIPKVALMLKNSSSFIRGQFLSKGSYNEGLSVKFINIPKNSEIVLVAFIDANGELLFSSKELKIGNKADVQQLNLQPLNGKELEDVLAKL